MQVVFIDLRSWDVNKGGRGEGDAEMQVPFFISSTEKWKKSFDTAILSCLVGISMVFLSHNMSQTGFDHSVEKELVHMKRRILI